MKRLLTPPADVLISGAGPGSSAAMRSLCIRSAVRIAPAGISGDLGGGGRTCRQRPGAPSMMRNPSRPLWAHDFYESHPLGRWRRLKSDTRAGRDQAAPIRAMVCRRGAAAAHSGAQRLLWSCI